MSSSSGLSFAGESLLFIGGLGGMTFLGVFGIAALGAWAEGMQEGKDFEGERRSRSHFAPQVPGQCPLMPSLDFGNNLAGMCRRCGSSGGSAIPPTSTFSSSSTTAWTFGMRAYEGFGQGARSSQRERVQAMADGELFDLMEEIVQESRRRRTAARQ
ncbi:uncharacterized protein PV07_01837 [Cladophialophora immunda]|uniref:Uncharacterized protein n=1 Tax=Cladophialophora immunda TaxID=569365 RepID=A0A0D2CYW8_9EURO|nr:uncharacterized protein PV07_01837 [Cladophialophora immunda]KIW35120.1 hypothetical protein PV07_01837 [Cladophialophora immunda]